MLQLVDNKAVDMIATAQTVTGSWADLGDIFFMGDKNEAALWVELVIHSSQNVRFRFLVSPDAGFTKSYQLPIQNVSSDHVAVLPQYFELDSDADQNILIPLEVGDMGPYVKVQVMAGTVGMAGASVTTAKLSVRTIGG